MSTYGYMSLDDRRRIEALLSGNASRGEIARALNVHLATIYREIKRGSSGGSYSAEFAQKVFESNLRARRHKQTSSPPQSGRKESHDEAPQEGRAQALPSGRIVQ